jgi:hypothetical protein
VSRGVSCGLCDPARVEQIASNAGSTHRVLIPRSCPLRVCCYVIDDACAVADAGDEGVADVVSVEVRCPCDASLASPPPRPQSLSVCLTLFILRVCCACSGLCLCARITGLVCIAGGGVAAIVRDGAAAVDPRGLCGGGGR